jgi:hypothetical protein
MERCIRSGENKAVADPAKRWILYRDVSVHYSPVLCKKIAAAQELVAINWSS